MHEMGDRSRGKPLLIRRLVLSLLLMSFGLVEHPALARGMRNGAADHESLPRIDVSRAIELATGYLERACSVDGKFVYEINTETGRESSDYNILRHEGAMYALAMANHAHPDPKAVDAMVRAAKFLRKNYIGPGIRPDQLVVWSRPLTETSENQYADLGGTGLGLVALAVVRKFDPNLVPLSDLQAMGRFALFLQKDDGSFVHKYSRQSGPLATQWESLYYPGEAALGFISLYELDHSRQWLFAAARAISYLAKKRAHLSVVPPDHWALIATASLFPYLNQIESTTSQEQLLQHAIQICGSIVHDQFRGAAAVGLNGAFDAAGRTAPAAA